MRSVSGSAWCFRCSTCGVWASNLHIGINGAAHHQLDEDLRQTGLERLRRQNNATVLKRLASEGLRANSTLLDVGAAHGWFIAAARKLGFVAEGIEPDHAIASRACESGISVRAGYFPDAVGEDERFDAICFNDVLEHIPDVRLALAACSQRLNPGGIVSINIPNSRGVAYRSALLARRFGLTVLFDRLWQVDLPSPHLWYFDEQNLVTLCASIGLRPAFIGRLPSLTRTGLWQRAHEDRRPSVLSVLGFALAWLSAPILNCGAMSDIMHIVVRKPDA